MACPGQERRFLGLLFVLAKKREPDVNNNILSVFGLDPTIEIFLFSTRLLFLADITLFVHFLEQSPTHRSI